MGYNENVVKGGPAPTCDDYGEKGFESGDDPGVPGEVDERSRAPGRDDLAATHLAVRALAHGSLTTRALSRRAGMPESALSRHLAKLSSRGMAFTAGGRHGLCTPDHPLARVLLDLATRSR